MGAANGHVLFLGTMSGLFLGEPSERGYIVRPLGFERLGHFRAPVLADCGDPSVLYAGTTRAGMFRSRDGGRTWQEINAGLMHKTVWSITQDPRTETLYVGTSPACVFVSNDQGDTWSECESLEHLPTTKQWSGPVPPHVSRMKGLALSGDAPIIYGTIEEGWAVRSLDGGKSWEQISEGFDHDGHWVAVLPGEPDAVVASTGKGMFRSDDRGAHWQEANQGLEGRRYTSAPVVGHPSRPGFLLTAVTGFGPGSWDGPQGGDSAFARSDDGGRSWQMLTKGLPQPCSPVPRGLAVADDEPDRVFAGMMDGTVWTSGDGGESFRQVLEGLPPIMSVSVAQK